MVRPVARALLLGLLWFNGDAAFSAPSVAAGTLRSWGLSVVPEALSCQLCRTARLIGPVQDCNCDFETVDAATHAYFHPLLKKLQLTGFFRHFKVHLDKGCPFWDQSEELCMMRDCAVELCEKDEIPSSWLTDEQPGEAAASDADGHANGMTTAEAEGKNATVPRTVCHSESDLAAEHENDPLWFVERKGGENHLSVNRWSEGGSPDVWIEQDEDEGMVYVDLLENPERFTGYAGPSAQRVWRAIHEENCFDTTSSTGGECLEQRVFYRLISGLQSSISTHIAREYYFGNSIIDDGYWGPNTKLFVDRVGVHPERLHNMYFAYLFMLRALAKAAPELELFSYETGNATDDSHALALMRALVRPDHPLVDAAGYAQVCQQGFDESRLFSTVGHTNGVSSELSDLERHLTQQSALELRTEFQGRFRNISRIMDCVGCEKCRLWGKLQILGLGTALKILMTEGDAINLQRNEIIAFINTLAQLSKSVYSVNEWRQRELQDAATRMASPLAFALAVAALLSCVMKRQKKISAEKNKEPTTAAAVEVGPTLAVSAPAAPVGNSGTTTATRSVAVAES
eukprot:CAMPEP_0118974022 /NCGR_PEP_ID=MMETSP1173-20130426/11027_1 /TAXON_ID=1034831 /ORGANISM="Rhizochromulina marina cf, Strain CCMP1243" /LENGTH=571 /DNA_ID=CAMNT_0006923723 /DNA_START=43 /DNA_END=1758 /DNA_ORIENTATION=-